MPSRGLLQPRQGLLNTTERAVVTANDGGGMELVNAHEGVLNANEEVGCSMPRRGWCSVLTSGGCSIQSNGVLRSLRCFRSYRSFGSLRSNRYCCLLSLLDPFGFKGL